MALISACDKCGYRPRLEDAHFVEVEGRFSSSENEVQTLCHVICYDCGHEWVE